MKKVTLITGYYYPEDTAVGLYNAQMVEYLESKGYEVVVVTGFPNYPQWKIRSDYKNKNTFLTEKIGKTKVYRYKQFVPSNPTFLKRILLIIDFTFGSFINILRIKKTDVIICIVPYTSTVFLGWLLKLKTKSKLWCHIQDFEFDAAQETFNSASKTKVKSFLFRLLYRIERAILGLSDVNSTISLSMINKLEIKSSMKAYYFPNWIDENKINPSTAIQHEYMKSNKFKILYSGNIGEKQDWDFFLRFAKELENHDVEIIVVGDGAKKKWLRDRLETFKNVKYYEPIEYKDLSNLLCSADLHILFQKNDVVDSVMPSKLLGMMASEKPSLVIGNIKSEVRTIIDDAEAGFYFTNEELGKCISTIEKLILFPEIGNKRGFKARKFIVERFSSEKVLSKFEKCLSDLVEK